MYVKTSVAYRLPGIRGVPGLEFIIRILAPSDVPPERPDPMLGLTDAVDWLLTNTPPLQGQLILLLFTTPLWLPGAPRKRQSRKSRTTPQLSSPTLLPRRSMWRLQLLQMRLGMVWAAIPERGPQHAGGWRRGRQRDRSWWGRAFSLWAAAWATAPSRGPKQPGGRCSGLRCAASFHCRTFYSPGNSALGLRRIPQAAD